MSYRKWGFTEYKEAKQYLIDSGKIHELDNELSTDGYTLVELANYLYGKEVMTMTDRKCDETCKIFDKCEDQESMQQLQQEQRDRKAGTYDPNRPKGEGE